MINHPFKYSLVIIVLWILNNSAFLKALRTTIGVALHVRRWFPSFRNKTIRREIIQHGQDTNSIGHGPFKEVAMKCGDLCKKYKERTREMVSWNNVGSPQHQEKQPSKLTKEIQIANFPWNGSRHLIVVYRKEFKAPQLTNLRAYGTSQSIMI